MTHAENVARENYTISHIYRNWSVCADFQLDSHLTLTGFHLEKVEGVDSVQWRVTMTCVGDVPIEGEN